MKGIYRIIVQNRKIKYDFEIKRNITVIRGDSATGKTALVDMIREYYEVGEESGIELSCTKTCAVLEGKNWQVQLAVMTDSIIFIDEGNSFVSSKEFASAIQNTNNYYVIVTRESLATLPYSVNEIYGIRNSGKYGQLKQTYNEFFHIYNLDNIQKSIRPEVVITEDSNAGYQFFENVCERNNIQCESAEGKSNMFRNVKNHKEESVLVIADGAAFGPEMEKLMKQASIQGNITLYLPESFEWLILNSEIIKNRDVEKMLENPAEHIEGADYFSWERFFTYYLTEKTKGTYLQYSKSVLNKVYLQEGVSNKILAEMRMIEF